MFLVKFHVKMTGLGHFQGLISDVTQKLMKNTAQIDNRYWMMSIKMKKVTFKGPVIWLDLAEFIPKGSLSVVLKLLKMQKSDVNARFRFFSPDLNLCRFTSNNFQNFINFSLRFWTLIFSYLFDHKYDSSLRITLS